MPSASYAVDIGVYNLGANGQVLASTTTAWARSVEGACSFDGIKYLGSCEEGIFAETTKRTWRCGRKLSRLVDSITADIEAGFSVSVGFEAPMWFPIELKESANLRLFKPRFADESESQWYLQSGAAAIVKAVSIGAMLVSLLASKQPELQFTTDPSSSTYQTIVLYEAFVVGEGKFKMPRPAGETQAENEWDALTASLAWGAINCKFDTPSSANPKELHKAGSSDCETASVWQMVASLVPSKPRVEGPSDCQIVGLAHFNDAHP